MGVCIGGDVHMFLSQYNTVQVDIKCGLHAGVPHKPWWTMEGSEIYIMQTLGAV